VVARVVVVALVDVGVRAGGRQPDLEGLAGLEVAGVELVARARAQAVALVVPIDESHDPAPGQTDVPIAHTVAERDRDVG
jgi:hypothetical protein